MVSQAKVFALEDLIEKIKTAKSAALIDYQGLTANQITDLRRKVKEAGGKIQVFKNTLITRALAQLGIELDQPLQGPTALVFANEDETAPLKIIDQSVKEIEKPEFKLGIFNQRLLSLEELKRLVGLPSKEALIAQFAGGLANPLSRLINSLNFNQRKLVLVLNQIAEKGGEENG